MTFRFDLIIDGVATHTGTLDATFDPATATLSPFNYTDLTDPGVQTHSPIHLTGPDSSGIYTGDKSFTHPFSVHGHAGRTHIHFSFSPGPNPRFFNGILTNVVHTKKVHKPFVDDLQWLATADGVDHSRGKIT